MQCAGFRSDRVKFPRNTIRVLKGDVPLPERLVELEARVFNPGRVELYRDPFEFGVVRAGERRESEAKGCEGDEDAVKRVGIHWATEQCRDLLDNNVRGIHFYTLNQSDATREIYANLGVSDSVALGGGGAS